MSHRHEAYSDDSSNAHDLHEYIERNLELLYCQVDVDLIADVKSNQTVVFKVYITEKFKWFTSLGFDGVDLDRILQHAERINSERIKESRFVFI